MSDSWTTLNGPGPWFRRRRKDAALQTTSLDSTNAFSSLLRGQSIVDSLVNFGEAYESGKLSKLADNTSGEILGELAQRLDDDELGLDVYVDNDPRENAAHAQWRRRAFGRLRPSAEPVHLRILASLADDSPSLASSVTRLLGALLALVGGIGLFLKGLDYTSWATPWPPLPTTSGGTPLSSADALVTILLLVPGLLLTRLDVQSHRTVLGRLRLIPRYLAYAGVLATCGLSLALATRPGAEAGIWILLTVLIIAGLLALAVVDGVLRFWRKRTFAVRLRALPKWLRTDMSRVPAYPRRHPTARFTTVGEETDDQ